GGLDFDSGCGTFQVDLDSNNRYAATDSFGSRQGGCVAFARGKNDYLPCAPCESYPLVREYWMGQVDRILRTGVDGVDLRVSCHSTLTDEPFEYGFNEVIVENYRRRYGTDIPWSDEGRKRLADLRGEAYTSFIGEASQRVRAKGAKMYVHVHAEAFRSGPCPG